MSAEGQQKDSTTMEAQPPTARHNRRASVTNSEFAWIGDTAMAAWGYTDEFGSNGTVGCGSLML